MQRFLFRLQRVLELWRERADAEQARLQGLLSQQAALEEQHRQVERERQTAERELVASRSVTAADLMMVESFRRFARRQCRQIERQQAECAASIERQRQVLIEARRNARLMEKLRENRLVEWRREFDRELEEIAAESYLASLARRRPRDG